MLDLGLPTFDDDFLRKFAAEIIKTPANRDNIAMRLCLGDFSKTQALLREADTPAFVQMLMQMKGGLTAEQQLVDKASFMIECRDAMANSTGKLKLEWAQFYAKMAGFVEDTIITTNNTVHVIAIPAMPTTANNVVDVNAWEAQSLAHQDELQREAKTIQLTTDRNNGIAETA